jgi:hypothetical protein
MKLPPQAAAVRRRGQALRLGPLSGVGMAAVKPITKDHIDGVPAAGFVQGGRSHVQHIRCAKDMQWCYCASDQAYMCCPKGQDCATSKLCCY